MENKDALTFTREIRNTRSPNTLHDILVSIESLF